MSRISTFEAAIKSLGTPDIKIARRADEFFEMVESGANVVIRERPPIERDWARTVTALRNEGVITDILGNQSEGVRWINRMGPRPQRWPRWKRDIENVKDRYAKTSLHLLHARLQEWRALFSNRAPFLLTISFSPPYNRGRDRAHKDFDSVSTSNLSTNLRIRARGGGYHWIQAPSWSDCYFSERVTHQEPKNTSLNPRVLAIEQFDSIED